MAQACDLQSSLLLLPAKGISLTEQGQGRAVEICNNDSSVSETVSTEFRFSEVTSYSIVPAQSMHQTSSRVQVVYLK